MAVFHAVGIAGHIRDRTYELMLLLTHCTILATIIIAVAPYIMTADSSIVIWAGMTAVVTLGFKILGVPVLIGLNWVIVVLGAIAPTEEVTSVAWRQRYSR
jgi:putative membrane protein